MDLLPQLFETKIRQIVTLLFLFLACLSTAAAGPVVYIGNVGTDTQFNTLMNARGFNVPSDYSKEIFAAEFRYGNNSATGGEREFGLHRNLSAGNAAFIPDTTPPTSSPPINPTSNPPTASATGTVDHQWGSNALANGYLDFSIARASNTVTFTVSNGSTPLYSATFTDSTYLPGVNFLAIRLAANARNATNTASRIRIQNLNVNGTSYGDIESFDTTTDSSGVTNNFVFLGIDGDFVITGQTAIDWQGTAPSASNPSAQFKFFADFPNEVPEPSTYFMMATGLVAMIAGARRRSSRS
jgi:hypothetical protein